MHKILPAEIKGFKKSDEEKIEVVISKINKLLKRREKEIEAEILKYPFTQTTETNEAVLGKFKSGSERGSIADGIWQAKIYSYYKKWSSAVAYTNVGSEVININMAKYDLDDELSLVETLVHEYCHLVGLTHTFRRTADRNHSAPYAIGNIVAILYARYYKVKPKIVRRRVPLWKRLLFFWR